MRQQWLIYQEDCAVAMLWEHFPLNAGVASVESLGTTQEHVRKMHRNLLSQIVLQCIDFQGVLSEIMMILNDELVAPRILRDWVI
jgi:hypothetical protein